MTLDDELLDELVRGIVDSARPLRIVLFGSAARGEPRRDSDIDVLVVVRDDVDCRAEAWRIHRRLRGLGCAKDILVVRESDVERYGENPSLFLHTALTEGKELYYAVS
jgi:predicted nucleotidyltransferase